MTSRWLAPLALLVLSPALAHADSTPSASAAAHASAAPAPAASGAATPAAQPRKDAPAATAAKATPAKAAPVARKKDTPAKAEKKSEPAGAAAARPRPRRIIEQREAAAAKAGGEQRYDMTIAARPQQPIVNFVVEKTPVRFELPELHPGQYDVPTGLTR